MNKPPLKKILAIAAALCCEYGDIMSHRNCQDLPPRIKALTDQLTKSEKNWLDYYYQQWNSEGEDYDPEDDFWGDGMTAGFTIGRNLELLANPPQVQAIDRYIEKAIATNRIYREVDGRYCYAPETTGGSMDALLLRAIADKLDELNADWDAQVQADLAKGGSIDA